MIKNTEQLQTELEKGDELEIRLEDIKTAFVKLTAFLKMNHTIHNPSSSPKLDDYIVNLGRHGSVEEALAKASGLDFHSFQSVSSGSDCSAGVFIDRFFLEELLKESSNKNLVNAIKSETCNAE